MAFDTPTERPARLVDESIPAELAARHRAASRALAAAATAPHEADPDAWLIGVAKAHLDLADVYSAAVPLFVENTLLHDALVSAVLLAQDCARRYEEQRIGGGPGLGDDGDARVGR